MKVDDLRLDYHVRVRLPILNFLDYRSCDS